MSVKLFASERAPGISRSGPYYLFVVLLKKIIKVFGRIAGVDKGIASSLGILDKLLETGDGLVNLLVL